MNDPLNGPFPSSRDLTDYSDEPGYAIPAVPRFPRGEPCPQCRETEWGHDNDPQCCGGCGTRMCPRCGADFAEDYSEGAQDRLTDNLGAHIAQWHATPPRARLPW